MIKKTRKLAALLCALAVSTLLWGCGQTTPTGVDINSTYDTSSEVDLDVGPDQPEGDTDKWW